MLLTFFSLSSFHFGNVAPPLFYELGSKIRFVFPPFIIPGTAVYSQLSSVTRKIRAYDTLEVFFVTLSPQLFISAHRVMIVLISAE